MPPQEKQVFKKQGEKLSDSSGASKIQLGSDPLLEWMRAGGIPLTREKYLELADLKEPLGAEEELALPAEISRVERPK